MKTCPVCKRSFDPGQKPENPSQEAGAFLAEALWQDAGELCPTCLANRGLLGMMYCREFTG